MDAFLILLLASSALAAVAVRHVPRGQVHSVYRHGAPHRWLRPGTHVLVPALERIGHRIDLGGQLLRFGPGPGADAASGVVYWQVLDPERADAVIDGIEQLIRAGLAEALEGQPSGDAEQRRHAALQAKQRLNGTLRDRGLMVTRIELDPV